MKITNIKPIHRKSFVASFDLEHSKMIIECNLMRGKSGFFITYPSRSYQDAQGQTKFWSMVKWQDKETAEKATAWIIEQLRNQAPYVFEAPKTQQDEEYDSSLPF